ncbi:DUF4286 family protein [Bradyrhizobium liaoningense]|uniref:DUF4286 family protein n=1 Tax=Bradyrhizobium liaoningense TaxID=43992 RepID=UPI001BAC2DA8|nr:DUF4286 family protein [Bradyrhizobium liaoningense]MBR0820779.1 hypothetical protein [Bradyrhizobium liaoningense]
MALLGKGVLAIWNGIKPEAEDDFVAWHVREHIPERVGLAGFLRGRRYVALNGHPKYFNFYETLSTADLSSATYQARLNAPTDWTRQVVAHFLDTSRTICDVAWSIGLGEGGFIEAISFETTLAPNELTSVLRSAMNTALQAIPGIVGIHLLQGRTEAGLAQTAERALRGGPDKVAAWILLIEGSSPEALARFRTTTGNDSELERHGAASRINRGLYALQFALTKAEISAS